MIKLRIIKKVFWVESGIFYGKVVVMIVILASFQLIFLKRFIALSQFPWDSLFWPLERIFIWRIHYWLGLVFYIEEKPVSLLTSISIIVVYWLKI